MECLREVGATARCSRLATNTGLAARSQPRVFSAKKRRKKSLGPLTLGLAETFYDPFNWSIFRYAQIDLRKLVCWFLWVFLRDDRYKVM